MNAIKGQKNTDFNSLAPCGANPDYLKNYDDSYVFQLTRPVWGEPREAVLSPEATKISTHSPRVGRTRSASAQKTEKSDFNSLAPCGANP